ncbi:hypothetical protein PHYSODRAFT_336455 [Phytophthora sojae]|uniref:Uncharacterized protein n=1 Tax=Phytophthora sojae (strain P6497) TaxID=1094619 RepID=G4ZYC2_PHYSP|nr:hypothetical protein PHYSODRAFT_336455 [Phytophthora sojae]EGZ11974.1 hypothetical protein PHYSODRAFT_336455 [Phytophthora sojae]|eukprot:XP_009532307.1 hypothetical protein PHYSODRAFT_336455 [Phytophthora sojae]
MALERKLQQNSSDGTCVYGLLIGPLAWMWVYLDSKEGRFCRTLLQPDDLQPSIYMMVTIARAIMWESLIIKTSQQLRTRTIYIAHVHRSGVDMKQRWISQGL